ncbi:hypothetical protein MC885_012279 [Smutsia gigantea]|nr:hypothetical protein MC885_012279 [Smutsia gigantea]
MALEVWGDQRPALGSGAPRTSAPQSPQQRRGFGRRESRCAQGSTPNLKEEEPASRREGADASRTFLTPRAPADPNPEARSGVGPGPLLTAAKPAAVAGLVEGAAGAAHRGPEGGRAGERSHLPQPLAGVSLGARGPRTAHPPRRSSPAACRAPAGPERRRTAEPGGGAPLWSPAEVEGPASRKQGSRRAQVQWPPTELTATRGEFGGAGAGCHRSPRDRHPGRGQGSARSGFSPRRTDGEEKSGAQSTGVLPSSPSSCDFAQSSAAPRTVVQTPPLFPPPLPPHPQSPSPTPTRFDVPGLPTVLLFLSRPFRLLFASASGPGARRCCEELCIVGAPSCFPAILAAVFGWELAHT